MVTWGERMLVGDIRGKVERSSGRREVRGAFVWMGRVVGSGSSAGKSVLWG